MAGNMKKEEMKMDNIEIKEETQEEIFPSSTIEDTCNTCTVEDTCIVYMKEEDVKIESQGTL